MKSGTRHLQDPLLIVGIDNSASMRLGDSSLTAQKMIQIMESFEESINDKFDIKWNLIGRDVVADKNVSFDEKETSLSSFIDILENDYFNRNVGAAVLFSDGLFNRGQNPVYLPSSFEYPIHSVLLGDTSVHRDASVSNVKHNQIAYLGNKFEIDVSIEAEKLKGNRSNVQIMRNGEVLADTNVSFTKDHFFQTIPFFVKAEESGIQHFIVRLLPIDGEAHTENNIQHIYVEVLEGKQRILLLAGAPHPDISALSNAILNNDKYELTVSLADVFDRNLEPYQLVIMHQVPAKKGRKGILQLFDDLDIPIWYILGQMSDQRKIPGLMEGFEMTGLSGSQEALPLMNNDFSLFIISESLSKQVKNWPPLRVPHESNQFAGSIEPLFYQRIGSVNTPFLLWGFSKINGAKSALLTGEGLWKWRLHDFLRNDSHDNFDNLIQSTVQYLGLNEDKSRFRLSNENLFNANENVEFVAELYNESFEMINDEQVSITIKDSTGSEFQRTFITAGNRYYLDAGRFEPGEYSYNVSTSIGSENFTEQGVFTVTELLIEQRQLVANADLMRNLSYKHSGEMFFLNQLDDLKSKLMNDEDVSVVSHYTYDVRYLIDFTWIFILIILLFSLEWFLRKRNGLY